MCAKDNFEIQVEENQEFGVCKRAYDPQPDKDPADRNDLGKGCFKNKFTNIPIAGCTCDPLCHNCGYGNSAEAVNKSNRCLSCPQDYVLKKLTGQDFGKC